MSSKIEEIIQEISVPKDDEVRILGELESYANKHIIHYDICRCITQSITFYKLR